MGLKVQRFLPTLLLRLAELLTIPRLVPGTPARTGRRTAMGVIRARQAIEFATRQIRCEARTEHKSVGASPPGLRPNGGYGRTLETRYLLFRGARRGPAGRPRRYGPDSR